MTKTIPENKYPIAKQAYKDLVKADSQLYVQRKVMHCLPQHKQKFHRQILAQVQAKKLSALSTYSVAAEKLSPLQLMLLRSEVYA